VGSGLGALIGRRLVSWPFEETPVKPITPPINRPNPGYNGFRPREPFVLRTLKHTVLGTGPPAWLLITHYSNLPVLRCVVHDFLSRYTARWMRLRVQPVVYMYLLFPILSCRAKFHSFTSNGMAVI